MTYCAHCPLVTTFGALNVGHLWSWKWPLVNSVPSHCLNQLLPIVNWIPWNKFQCKLKQNITIFSIQNTFQNIVGKMSAILFMPGCVRCFTHSKILICSLSYKRPHYMSGNFTCCATYHIKPWRHHGLESHFTSVWEIWKPAILEYGEFFIVYPAIIRKYSLEVG